MSDIDFDAAKHYAERRSDPMFVYLDEGNLARAYLAKLDECEQQARRITELKALLQRSINLTDQGIRQGSEFLKERNPL